MHSFPLCEEACNAALSSLLSVCLYLSEEIFVSASVTHFAPFD